ncbi:unnamed protein product [Closterium sp. Yama58-4]|nr:unnamed protein product [Closterium sp. Yama58-4]
MSRRAIISILSLSISNNYVARLAPPHTHHQHRPPSKQEKLAQLRSSSQGPTNSPPCFSSAILSFHSLLFPAIIAAEEQHRLTAAFHETALQLNCAPRNLPRNLHPWNSAEPHSHKSSARLLKTRPTRGGLIMATASDAPKRGELRYAMVSRGVDVLAEHSMVKGDLSATVHDCLAQLPKDSAVYVALPHGDFTIAFQTEKEYVFGVLADKEVARDLLRGFLGKLQLGFMPKYSTKARALPAGALQREFGPKLKQQLQQGTARPEKLSKAAKEEDAKVEKAKVQGLVGKEKAQGQVENAQGQVDNAQGQVEKEKVQGQVEKAKGVMMKSTQSPVINVPFPPTQLP